MQSIIGLLFCFAVIVIKGMITTPPHAFWLMFSQSQMIIVHLLEWLNILCVCVCVAPGPALHWEILTVAGSLMEPVRGYCLVICKFETWQQCIVQILQMKKIPRWFFSSTFSGLDMNRTLNMETLPIWETATVRISRHAIYPQTRTLNDNTLTHLYGNGTWFHRHTPWACTLTPVTTPVTCPYINLCAVLTHTSTYSTWPSATNPARQSQTWTCTITGHVQLVQIVEALRKLMARKMCLSNFTLKTFLPSFVPTKHDPGWTAVLIWTRGPPVRKGHC